jgi:hypothetical protein
MAQVCCRRGLLDRIAMRGARTKINVSRQQGLKGQR